MKVLLVYPYPLFDRSPAHEEDIRAIPIGLYYVGAVLIENGHQVNILNWYDVHKRPEVIEETLKKEKPQVLGFSVLNANRWGGLEIAQIAKKIDSHVITVFGGVAATFLWEHFLRHFPQVDYVITGEGEVSFLALVEALEKGDRVAVMATAGLAYREKGTIQKNPNATMIRDLDTCSIPARHFTYQHVVSSRGCPAKCAFCGSPTFWQNKIRFRSPENFVKELELLYQKGVRHFYFSDDTFTVKKDRVVAICHLILEKALPITWYGISRADYIDGDMLYWMRKAGCVQMSFGVESGSLKIRKVLGKELDNDQVKAAFSLTHRHGIMARAYFIYGSPGETWETIQETVALIEATKPFICLTYILEIYPGTKLYKDYKKRFGKGDDVWLKRIEGICYFETDPKLSQEQVFAFGKRIRDAVYANVTAAVDLLDFVDRQDLYPLHADFCSRLGMTFSHGEFASVEAIRNKDGVAEKLFRKALDFWPDHRAYLGMGLLMQRQGAMTKAERYFFQGIKRFSDSVDLHVGLAVTFMNQGRFREALEHLSPFQEVSGVQRYVDICYQALGEVST